MKLSSLLFFILLSFAVKAQTHISLDSLDNILVYVDDKNNVYYDHRIQPGETVFSLAKFFSCDYKDLLRVNGYAFDEIIPQGALIKIPINNDMLIKSARVPKEKSIPVHYEVKRRETLFKISHVYFDQRIEDLIIRNNVKKLALKTGEQLTVGWWPAEKTTITKESNPAVLDSIYIMNDTRIENDSLAKEMYVRDSIISYTPLDSLQTKAELKVKSHKGIAIWDKNDENTETLIVLHKSAKIGSVIKLQNPVTEIITVAQVVGHIPANVYQEDIDLIISRAVAQKLGILDTRLQLLMSYYE